MAEHRGKVYLIGAGPGDEGLLTLKGAECLRMADVVIYDYLVGEGVLKHCPESCEMIYVGKKAGCHTLSQEEINDLIVQRARKSLVVARLKGGDPFVFGRGGEEALHLVGSGVDFEVVPGVTAATAVTAYAGIPLTHRGMSSSAILVTGHESADKGVSSVDWEKIARGTATLVCYMGIKNLSSITEKLVEGGRPGCTPTALIRWGTLNSQQTLTGTLEDIAGKAREAGFEPPAIIVVGEVVSLRDKLKWFDRRPLWGKKIVVSRSRQQASVLAGELRALGADVVEFPTIKIEPVSDLSCLDDAIERIDSFDWIIFTSVNASELFFERLYATGRDARKLGSVRIAVIGKATETSLLAFGIRPDLIPQRYLSEGLVEAFKGLAEGPADAEGKKILIPGSEIAREHVSVELRKMGAEVEKIVIYRNVTPEYQVEYLDEIFGAAHDLVTFTSSSTVSNLVDILENHQRTRYIAMIRGASIGPVTSAEAGRLNVAVAVEAQEHTIAGLVDSILNFFDRKEKQ